MVGAETYQLMQSLVAPEKPAAKGFDAIVKLIQDQYQPTPSVIVQRFKFKSRTPRSGESIATFVAKLWKLAERFKFQATLDDMLRDRLVCGVTDGYLQHHLLTKPELTLKDTIKIAIAQETAENGAQQLQQQQRPQLSTLHKVGQTNKQSHRPPTKETLCYRCGGNNHGPSECQFKDAECHSFKKKGHLARVCCKFTHGRTPQPQSKDQISAGSSIEPLIKWKQKLKPNR